MEKIRILYEDTQLIILYKPAGVPVQSARVGAKDCESMLKNYLYEKAPEKGAPYLGVIHRLDQPVEGLLVFAKTPAAAAELSRQVTDGRMKKCYLAIRRAANKSADCVDNLGNACGKNPENVDNFVEKWIEQVDYLKKEGRNNQSEIVSQKTPGAKKAVLRYRVRGSRDGCQLVEIQLLTGRHHQIRVQMAGLGTPLLGDRKYGPENRDVDNVDNSFPALCAYHLEFVHPNTKKHLEFEVVPEHPAFRKFAGEI